MKVGDWYKEDKGNGRWNLAHIVEKKDDKCLCHLYKYGYDCLVGGPDSFGYLSKLWIQDKSISLQSSFVSSEEANRLIKEVGGEIAEREK